MTVEDHAPDSSDATLQKMLGYAWLALTFALVVHIIDEAEQDFVTVYQPLTALAHDYAPFLPVPDLSFAGWLAGLAGLVIALLLLTPAAFRGGRGIRGVAYALSALMTANALTHCLSSLHFNRLMPGTWTAMLLMTVAAWLYVAARRTTPGHHLPFDP